MSEKDGVIICDGCGKHGADCEISEMGQDFCDWRCSEKATLARVGRAFVTGMETLTTSSGVVTGCLPAAFAANEREMYEQMHDQVILFRRDSDKWAAEAAEQKARADRYLAAMTELIDAESQAHNATAPVPPAVSRYLAALESLRAIVEEDRHG